MECKWKTPVEVCFELSIGKMADKMKEEKLDYA